MGKYLLFQEQEDGTFVTEEQTLFKAGARVRLTEEGEDGYNDSYINSLVELVSNATENYHYVAEIIADENGIDRFAQENPIDIVEYLKSLKTVDVKSLIDQDVYEILYPELLKL